MIFAEKLILLRKKSGWSQEEIADQMKVSRQSVSKWEGAQSIPDLEKLIRLSDLFGVSLDYLLKDHIEKAEDIQSDEARVCPRRVSMEEAHAFLTVREQTAPRIAFATLLCVLSPVCYFMLNAIRSLPQIEMSGLVSGILSTAVLLILAAAAAAIYVSVWKDFSRFDPLIPGAFETEYGVTGMVKERKEQYKETCVRNNILGSVLCILSLLPLSAGVMSKSAPVLAAMIAATLILLGIAAFFFVRTGVIRAGYERLLQEEGCAETHKNKYTIAIGLFYAVGLFLGIGVFFVCGLISMTGPGWAAAFFAGVCVFLVFGLSSHAIITLKRKDQ